MNMAERITRSRAQGGVAGSLAGLDPAAAVLRQLSDAQQSAVAVLQDSSNGLRRLPEATAKVLQASTQLMEMVREDLAQLDDLAGEGGGLPHTMTPRLPRAQAGKAVSHLVDACHVTMRAVLEAAEAPVLTAATEAPPGGPPGSSSAAASASLAPAQLWRCGVNVAAALQDATRLLTSQTYYMSYTIAEPSCNAMLSMGELAAAVMRQAAGASNAATAAARQNKLYPPPPPPHPHRQPQHHNTSIQGCGAGTQAGHGQVGSAAADVDMADARPQTQLNASEGQAGAKSEGPKLAAAIKREGKGAEGAAAPPDVCCLLAAHGYTLLLVACEHQPEGLLDALQDQPGAPQRLRLLAAAALELAAARIAETSVCGADGGSDSGRGGGGGGGSGPTVQGLLPSGGLPGALHAQPGGMMQLAGATGGPQSAPASVGPNYLTSSRVEFVALPGSQASQSLAPTASPPGPSAPSVVRPPYDSPFSYQVRQLQLVAMRFSELLADDGGYKLMAREALLPALAQALRAQPRRFVSWWGCGRDAIYSNLSRPDLLTAPQLQARVPLPGTTPSTGAPSSQPPSTEPRPRTAAGAASPPPPTHPDTATTTSPSPGGNPLLDCPPPVCRSTHEDKLAAGAVGMLLRSPASRQYLLPLLLACVQLPGTGTSAGLAAFGDTFRLERFMSAGEGEEREELFVGGRGRGYRRRRVLNPEAHGVESEAVAAVTAAMAAALECAVLLCRILSNAAIGAPAEDKAGQDAAAGPEGGRPANDMDDEIIGPPRHSRYGGISQAGSTASLAPGDDGGGGGGAFGRGPYSGGGPGPGAAAGSQAMDVDVPPPPSVKREGGGDDGGPQGRAPRGHTVVPLAEAFWQLLTATEDETVRPSGADGGGDSVPVKQEDGSGGGGDEQEEADVEARRQEAYRQMDRMARNVAQLLSLMQPVCPDGGQGVRELVRQGGFPSLRWPRANVKLPVLVVAEDCELLTGLLEDLQSTAGEANRREEVEHKERDVDTKRDADTKRDDRKRKRQEAEQREADRRQRDKERRQRDRDRLKALKMEQEQQQLPGSEVGVRMGPRPGYPTADGADREGWIGQPEWMATRRSGGPHAAAGEPDTTAAGGTAQQPRVRLALRRPIRTSDDGGGSEQDADPQQGGGGGGGLPPSKQRHGSARGVAGKGGGAGEGNGDDEWIGPPDGAVPGGGPRGRGPAGLLPGSQPGYCPPRGTHMGVLPEQAAYGMSQQQQPYLGYPAAEYPPQGPPMQHPQHPYQYQHQPRQQQQQPHPHSQCLPQQSYHLHQQHPQQQQQRFDLPVGHPASQEPDGGFAGQGMYGGTGAAPYGTAPKQGMSPNGRIHDVASRDAASRDPASRDAAQGLQDGGAGGGYGNPHAASAAVQDAARGSWPGGEDARGGDGGGYGGYGVDPGRLRGLMHQRVGAGLRPGGGQAVPPPYMHMGDPYGDAQQ